MLKCPDCGFEFLHQSGMGLWCPMCVEYKSGAEATVWERLRAMLERCECLQKHPCEVCAIEEAHTLVLERADNL